MNILRKFRLLGSIDFPHYPYGQAHSNQPQPVQELIIEAARILGKVGLPSHLKGFTGDPEGLIEWVLGVASASGAKVTINSSHFLHGIDHLTDYNYNASDPVVRREKLKFLADMDRVQRMVPNDLVDDTVLLDFEKLRFCHSPTTVTQGQNNVDLLALQTWMVDEIKGRWDVKVVWYKHFYIEHDHSTEPEHRYRPSEHTSTLTPGDGWSSAIYRESAPYQYTESQVEKCAEFGLMHNQVKGVHWCGPGYTANFNEEGSSAQFAGVNGFNPDPKTWYNWARRFTTDWWNKPDDIRHGRFFHWRDRLDGIALYPSPGGGKNIAQWAYLYAYFCGLLGLDYEDVR